MPTFLRDLCHFFHMESAATSCYDFVKNSFVLLEVSSKDKRLCSGCRRWCQLSLSNVQVDTLVHLHGILIFNPSTSPAVHCLSLFPSLPQTARMLLQPTF